MSADGIKFRKPVLPGDTLFVHVEITKARRGILRASCHCTVNEMVVSEGEISINIFDR